MPEVVAEVDIATAESRNVLSKVIVNLELMQTQSEGVHKHMF